MIFEDFDDENDLNDLDDKVTGSARLVVTLKTVALWLHSSSTVIPSVSSLSGFGSSGAFSLVNRSWDIQINRP